MPTIRRKILAKMKKNNALCCAKRHGAEFDHVIRGRFRIIEQRETNERLRKMQMRDLISQLIASGSPVIHFEDYDATTSHVCRDGTRLSNLWWCKICSKLYVRRSSHLQIHHPDEYVIVMRQVHNEYRCSHMLTTVCILFNLLFTLGEMTSRSHNYIISLVGRCVTMRRATTRVLTTRTLRWFPGRGVV